MAKSDFDLDDQEYDVVYDDSKKKSLLFKEKKKSKKSLKSDNSSLVDNAISENLSISGNDVNDISNTSDLGDFSNVVFDDNVNLSPVEKISDYFSTINVRFLVVVGGIFLIVFVISFLVALTIIKSNKAYESEIMIPDIVYIGETSNMYSSSKYVGSGKAKKDVNSTETTFTSLNEKVLYILNKSVTGSFAVDTIIPVQEGRAKVEVVSKLDGKTISSAKKTVVVCPAFEPSLLNVKHISLTKDSEYQLSINYGENECSRGVTYTSSNESVATVDSNGSIKGIEVGKSILTIKRGTKTISLTIDVTDKDVSLKSFKIVPSELQLVKGEKFRLNVDYSPSNATGFSVVFESKDREIVNVSEDGLVEALAPGKTTISVTTSSYTFNTDIAVNVKDNKSDAFPTSVSLDKSDVVLTQGGSSKIWVSFSPEDVSNDVISYKSSDEEVAVVVSNGIIYAKKPGKAIITVSTNNGISKYVKVYVTKMKTPILRVSDGITSNNWHTKPYVLSFFGSENGAFYYYGESPEKINSVSDRLIVSNDETKTYYIKACTRICSDTCTNKKDKNGDVVEDDYGNPIKECKSKCSSAPSICSDPVTYISKLDKTKPYVKTVVGIDDTPAKTDTVQIYIVDNISFATKWCVTNKKSYGNCKWKTIEGKVNPLVNYTAYKNGMYYVFVKDGAGNMSDAYEFEITSIE